MGLQTPTPALAKTTSTGRTGGLGSNGLAAGRKSGRGRRERTRVCPGGGAGVRCWSMWITVRAELVAELLRPGNAGLNTAADHVVVLDPQPLLRWINRFQTVWWIRRLRRCRHRESGAVTKASKLFSVAPAETDGTRSRAIRVISRISPIERGWVRERAGLTHSDVHRLQAAVGNRATRALLGPNVPVQRAMYLENQDDLIYKDSNNAHAEY